MAVADHPPRADHPRQQDREPGHPQRAGPVSCRRDPPPGSLGWSADERAGATAAGPASGDRSVDGFPGLPVDVFYLSLRCLVAGRGGVLVLDSAVNGVSAVSVGRADATASRDCRTTVIVAGPAVNVSARRGPQPSADPGEDGRACLGRAIARIADDDCPEGRALGSFSSLRHEVDIPLTRWTFAVMLRSVINARLRRCRPHALRFTERLRSARPMSWHIPRAYCPDWRSGGPSARGRTDPFGRVCRKQGSPAGVHRLLSLNLGQLCEVQHYTESFRCHYPHY